MPSIFLRRGDATQTIDDSGALMQMLALPIYYQGPYTEELLPHNKRALANLDYVAPLEYYCIKSLFHNVDQLDLAGAPRILYGGNTHKQLRLMKTLIPFFEQRMRPGEMKYIDPRLWATLVQLFAHLPPAFSTYTLPLSDVHLPFLQNVQSSVDFTLITVLDLSCETELTDDTIGHIKPLTNLSVFDMSSTRVSSWGIKQLSMCLTQDEASGVRFGLWNVRIWSMRGCKRIRDDVKPILQKFPLLAVVDLRGTSVTSPSLSQFESGPSALLQPCYYPRSTISWIDALWTLHSKQLFACSTEKPYILHVNTTEHPPPHMVLDHLKAPRGTKIVSEDDQVLVILPDGRQKCKTTDELTKVAPALSSFRYRRRRSRSMPSQDDEDDEDGAESEISYWSEEADSSGYPDQIWEETAGIATERLAARNFYASTGQFDFDDDRNSEEDGRIYPLITEEKELNLMFFRPPPSWDSVHYYSRPNTQEVNKRQRSEDVIMKKKKAGMAGFSRTIMDMRSGHERDEALNTTNPFSRHVVSVNPFRAKKAKDDQKPAQTQPPRQTQRSRTSQDFDMKAWSKKVKK